MVMRLWTWQKQGFHLADRSHKVKSLENSLFLNDAMHREHFKRVYEKLYERVPTPDFQWYFTEENEAKNEGSHRIWYDHGCVLWEVNVPLELIFRKVCNVAWTYLLKRPTIPPALNLDWQILSNYNQDQIKEWKRSFDDFWKGKSEEELWDDLFLETCVDGCTDILLCHPLEDSWIKRDPSKQGKWWKMFTGNVRRPGLYNRALPCDGCLGRGI
jgi:hypothetical protein